MSDIHLPVFCLLGGGGAGGRILDRERDGKEGKIRHQYTVYVLTCGLRGNRLNDFAAFIIRECMCECVSV